MRGFKSFAKHTEMVFGERFNVVIGPNGSGKSNVLDSLCFVLGKTSAKSMRAERSANLIYNGGKSKSPAKDGEVSIFFDNKNKRFPTDDPEVKITRVVRNNGQSIYKINDKVRTRQEIVDLLGLGKINPDGYNIILQGDITKFVEMPPSDRRLLVEEIAGISVYEEKKQKAVNQLTQVEERLKEAEIVLAERNTYLKELKRDRDQAQKFKDMEDKVSQNKATVVHKQMGRKQKEKNVLKEDLDKTKEELQKINQKVQESRSEIIQKKEKVEEIGKEIEEKGEVEQVNLNKDIENVKIDLVKKKTRRETINQELVKIEKRKEELNLNTSELHEKIKALEQKKSEETERKNVLEKQKKELMNKISHFRDENKLADMADVEQNIEEKDKEAESLQQEIHAIKEQQHALIREQDAIDHQLSTLDDQIKKVESIAKEHEKEITDLKNKKTKFKESTVKLNTCLNEDSSLAVQIDKAREEQTTARENLATLEARSASIKETSKLDLAMKKVLELKQNNEGIHGTLFELGQVDPKYATALETAAGNRIKSIVVENDKVATHLIKYLKTNKLGTATFLPLQNMRPKETVSEVKKLANAKGVVGLATDLINFEPKFKKAFAHIFSNTLIIDSIDGARRLGVGKAKMVTIDGDVAERSGAMSGGFHKKRQGLKFNEKEIDSSVEEAEEKLEQNSNTVQVLEKRRRENEDEISGLRQLKGSLEGEIIKAEKSLHLDSSDLDVSKEKKEELKQQAKKIQEKKTALEESIEEKNKHITENRQKRQDMKSKIAELRDPKLLAELATFEEKRNELLEQVGHVDATLSNIENQMTEMHTPEIEKATTRLNLLTKEQEEFRTEKEYLGKEIQEQEESLQKKESSAKEFSKKYRALFEQRNEIDKEISTLENRANNKTDESRKVEIKENTLTLKHAEAASELAGLQQEFSQYEGVQLVENKTEEQLKYEINKFEKMKTDIGSVNMRALEIYSQVEKEYTALLDKKDTLFNEREDVLKMMEEIEGKKRELFMKHFDIVNNTFKDIFARLSTKGEANLELENKENPFEGGVDVRVRMTGKRFLDIRSLSGGEKTMTALAFIFAIQENEPASFYILDEVDAALDKTNSEKLANLVNKYADNAQYIMISHNDGVINSANTLYGVSMDEHGMSNVVSLKV